MHSELWLDRGTGFYIAIVSGEKDKTLYEDYFYPFQRMPKENSDHK